MAQVIREDQIEPFARTNEADFAYQRDDVGRFRVNAFRQWRGGHGVPPCQHRRPESESLGVPDPLYPLALEPRGLVLVTGPTGSGKTTTLAGMIDHINLHRSVNIVTIEDPIEVIHHDKMAMVNQREVGMDTGGFPHRLRGAMRQDPDVILVGEMRDAETVKAALAAAETGHFVMSTLHTVDAQRRSTASSTSSRRTSSSRFASHWPGPCAASVPAAGEGLRQGSRGNHGDRDQHRPHRRRDHRRRQDLDDHAAGARRRLLRDADFDQHLIALYQQGTITLETAIDASTSPHDMQVEMRKQGIVG